ncbi:patatin-like protein 2 isoform X1 [Punica granatum]|nr:patatin-like protein 2 isoform X1 [Punica granatum]
MLTSPNGDSRPLFAAKDINQFYLDHCPRIFPQDSHQFVPVANMIKAVCGPKYNGKYLHMILKEILGSTRLHETLTNVVIPTFDIKRLQPTIFSSYEVKKNPSINAFLSDICISTSAAPSYLPAHYFETEDLPGKVREFNMIDGGVAANNPTLVAMGEVTKEIMGGSSDFFAIKPLDYRRFLVISLGTGAPKYQEKYSADEAAKWGVFGWLAGGGSTPLVDVSMQSSSDMVDFHLSALFRAVHIEENYLRICMVSFAVGLDNMPSNEGLNPHLIEHLNFHNSATVVKQSISLDKPTRMEHISICRTSLKVALHCHTLHVVNLPRDDQR